MYRTRNQNPDLARNFSRLVEETHPFLKSKGYEGSNIRTAVMVLLNKQLDKIGDKRNIYLAVLCNNGCYFYAIKKHKKLYGHSVKYTKKFNEIKLIYDIWIKDL